MTTPDTSLYATAAASVIDSAQRSGLTWRLIPGTIVSSSSTGVVTVLLDGDETQLSPAQSLLTPPPSVGDRVLVLVVPPQGNYVIGYYGTPPEVSGIIKDRVSSTANSGAIGAETVILTGNFMTFKAGRAYRVCWAQRLDHSAAQTSVVRVRRTDISGTQLSFWQSQVLGTVGITYYYEFRVKVLTGSNDVTDNLVQTLSTATGTTTARGAADTVRYMEIWDAGPETAFPDAFILT